MESLNLNTLVNSLPAQQNAEKELLNDFKAAALSITTLYRSSRKNSKRAYNAGYAAACQDLLNFIQQGVSASDIGQSPSGSSHAVEGRGMTIGRVMDWTEARVDAIKAREEEEEEDEEREKDKERTAPRPQAERPVGAASLVKSEDRKPGAASSANVSSSRTKDTTTSLPTPNSPVSHSSTQPPSLPPSPSPPPQVTLPRSISRLNKNRPAPTKESFHPTTQPTHFTPNFHSEAFEPSHSDTPIVIGTGAKRRHAVMMMLDHNSPNIGPSSAGSSPGGIGGTSGGGNAGSSLSKRRTRSSRNLHQLQPHNSNISVVQMAAEDMDIDEDGRERKRVARR